MEAWVRPALEAARHGVLVTVDAHGEPRPVPFTFALVGEWIVSVVDHKPKASTHLARLDDITRHGSAAALVDHYDDDWSTLWWIRVRGRAAVHAATDRIGAEALDALVTKYEPYRHDRPEGPVYGLRMDDVRAWRARD